MADHSETATAQNAPADDAAEAPDYAALDELTLEPDQLKLLLDPTRLRIIDLLSERAATTSQLADVLERPKGTIGHHCKKLESAGLIHVVRTRKVRAIDERYYGRTARLFIMGSLADAGVSADSVLGDSLVELRTSMERPSDSPEAHLASVRYARIDHNRAEEWTSRFHDLLDEFAAQPRAGSTTYGLLVGLFATERRGFE